MSNAAAEEQKALGNKALQESNFPKAIEHYTKAIELDPSCHVYYSNRAAAYTNCSLFDKAVEDADKAIELKPDWARGYSRKGAALCRQQKIMESMLAYKQGLEKCPGDASLTQGLQAVQQQAYQIQQQQMQLFDQLFGGDKMDKIAKHPALAQFAGQPDFEKMVNDVSMNCTNYARYAETPMGQALLQAALGSMGGPFEGEASEQQPSQSAASSSTSEAAEEKAAEEEPMDVEEEIPEERKQALELKAQGNGLYRKKQFEEAIECYNKAIELDPTDMSFLTNRAAAHFEAGDYDECIASCQSAIDVGRSNGASFQQIGKAYCRIGKAYTKQEKLGEAIEAYEKAQGEAKTRETAKLIRSLTAEKNKREKEAYIDVGKSLEAKERGNAKFREKDFKGAIEEYTEAIKRNPKDHLLYSNRATAYTKVMLWRECLKDCETCIELEPTFAKIYVRKGNAHMMCKEFDKALEAFRTGSELDPSNQELKDGHQRCIMQIQAARMTGQVDEEARQRALADPDIQQILRMPEIQNALQEAQRDPQALSRVMRNPALAPKIEKLLAAGVI